MPHMKLYIFVYFPPSHKKFHRCKSAFEVESGMGKGTISSPNCSEEGISVPENFIRYALVTTVKKLSGEVY